MSVVKTNNRRKRNFWLAMNILVISVSDGTHTHRIKMFHRKRYLCMCLCSMSRLKRVGGPLYIVSDVSLSVKRRHVFLVSDTALFVNIFVDVIHEYSIRNYAPIHVFTFS